MLIDNFWRARLRPGRIWSSSKA